jgi:hypothetical protein
MRTGLLTLGIAAGIAACGPALAQTPGAPTISNSRQMRIGGSLDFVYDANIAHSSEATARLRGLHPEEEILNPSVVFEIVQPFGRYGAFLQGNAGYDFHRYNPRLDHVNMDVSGGGQATIGPCRATGYGRFAAVQSNLEDVSLATVKNLMETTVSGGDATCGRQRGFNLSIQGSNVDVVNSDSRTKVADHRMDSVGGQFGYANERLGALGLQYSYGQASYPDRKNATGGFGDSYWSEMLGVTYQRNIGSKIKVQLNVGESIVKRGSAPPGIPLKVKGTTYSASLDYRMSQRLAFMVRASRAFQPSNRPGKLYDLVTHTEGAATYDLGTRIQVTLGGYVENLKSNQDTSPNALPTVTQADMSTEYLQVHYRQSKRLNVGLEVRHDDRETDLPQFNYSDTRATVSLASTF